MRERKTWKEIIQMPFGSLPRVPVEPIIGTTSPILVHFPSLYAGAYCIDLKISNLDLNNSLSYRLNKTAATNTLPAGGEVAFENTLIEYLEITPNDTTGQFEALPFILPPELLYK